jgi:glycosyltransferase involved in cell wall biosynthesis
VINPKISIIISVYNGEGYLKTAVRSIQNQDFKDIEIIIIDDFSTDNSVKIILNFKKI